MYEIGSKYEISKREFSRGRKLKIGAVAAPILLTAAPAGLFLLLAALFGGSPPTAITIFFFGVIATIIGLVIGLSLTAFFLIRHSNWTKEMRERIAADGIKANEVSWFKNELKSNERRALKEIKSTDLLLADAYQETLASRLTASRIVKSSKRELLLASRRKNKLKSLKSENAKTFLAEIDRDAAKIQGINEEATVMLAEAESRLQMIEAAAVRGGQMVDSELALKRLSARSEQLPLALEEVKMAEQIRLELEDMEADELGGKNR